MDKTLFLINTHFQLITSLQIIEKSSIMDVDFIITDNLLGYKMIAARLESLYFVNSVFTAETKDFVIPKNKKQKFKGILNVLIGKKAVRKFLNNFDGKEYSTFYFHNLDFFTYLLYDFVKNQSPRVIANRFEEGFSIYLTFVCRKKSEALCDSVAGILNRFSVKKDIKNVYLYHPELLTYDLKYDIVKITLLSKSDYKFIEMINYVFDYNGNESIEADSIIFEECFFADSGFMNDVPLFCKVAEMIGNEKVLIKLHPRNKKDRFSELGLKIMKNSSVPWEVVQINNDYRNKTFITITSGSVLASMLYFGESIKTIFLYKLVENGFKLKEHYEEYLYKLMNSGCFEVYVPESFSELETLLGDRFDERK